MGLSQPAHVVVAGGGLAATRVVEGLRGGGAAGRITLVGAEPHEPYDRPPLTKAVLRGERDVVPLRDEWATLDVDLRLGRRAVALHPDRHGLLLDDGQELSYDALVVATGATPRTIPGLAGPGVHVVRTLDDARALRADLLAHGRVTVVGGGFIGCEAAASARALGAEVTLVEALSAPLARVLGTGVGTQVAARHRKAGVDLRCGVSVLEQRQDGGRRELLLSDGSTVDGTAVLVGIGVVPDTGWLAGSGVEVDDGVLCDATGRTSIPGIWAAGDVARWLDPRSGEHLRAEHWTSAADQGAAVARDLRGEGVPLDEVPYVWSDQYDWRLQVLGRPHPDDELTVVRADGDRLLVLYARGGRLTGALGIGAARAVMRMRRLLADGASDAQALALAGAGRGVNP